jgi:monoamine oxidase
VADLLAGKVFRPTLGWGTLLEKIESDLQPRPSCSVQLQYRLTSVRSVKNAGSGRFELLFADPHGFPYLLYADRVILAMPRRALELVDFSSIFDFDGGPQVFTQSDWDRKLGCAVGIPAFKLGMLYDSPWWQSMKGWKNGVSVTDLPIRQLFYGMGQGPDADANQRVLIASYADTDSARFWAGLAEVSPANLNTGVNDEFEGTDRGNLLSAIQNQQQLLFGSASPLPEPKWVGYMDWGVDPYGGAWHEWKPGVDVISAIPEMRRPFPDLPVYVCGEAYSWMQAWIEGALISAEHVLQDYFKLSRPDWLPADYDLGP